MASAKGMVLALVLAALATGFVSVAAVPARAATDSITLYGSAQSGWGMSSTSEMNPGPTLVVSQGDSVTVTLHSTDGFQHEFLIDYNGNGRADAGEPVSAPFTNTTTVTFVANQTGSFRFFCVIHPTTMIGTFTVQGASAAPGGGLALGGGTLAVLGVVLVVGVAVGVGVLVMRRRPRAP